MADIGNLVIKIGANAAELERAFKQLGGSAAQFQRGLSTLGTVASTAFFAAAGAATALAIAAGKQAEELEQLASITGINTDKLQEYDVMLNRAGLNGQDLAQVMKQISTNLDQARQGTGTAGDRFRQLGIDIRTVTSTDDLIRKVSQSQAQFANGTQKAAVMSDLLGKGWASFMKAFAGGKKAFDDVTAASKDLGLSLSTNNLAVLGKMDNQVDDLMTAFKRFAGQLAVTIAPSIEFITKMMIQFLSFGSRAFHELNLLLDIFAVKIQHVGMQAAEVFGTLFSTSIFSPEAWAQTMANLKLIGQEEDKQIAKLKAAHAISRTMAPEDKRAQLPDMIDSAQVSARQIALLDVQLKAFESNANAMVQIGQALTDKQMARLDEEQAAWKHTDEEIMNFRKSNLAEQDALVLGSINKQIDYLNNIYIPAKRAAFTQDKKGAADLVKFNEEMTAKLSQLDVQRATSAINAQTKQIQTGLQFKSFWQRQFDDIKNSNAFSVAQIMTTWTSGVANAIVNGGKFAEQAWKATEIALIQGALNLAASWVLTEGIKVAATAAAGATIESIWLGVVASVTGAFAAMSTAVMAFMTETVIPALVGIGEAIADFLFAIGTAETVSIFGAEIGVATLAAAGLVLAAVGTLAAFAFDKGGIGNFGSGTPAMLHGTEAVIPLDSRGANFMQQAFGTGSGQVIENHLYVDGRELSIAVSNHLPGALRTMGTL